MYIADAHNHRVRQLCPLTGVVTTLAGSGDRASKDGLHGEVCRDDVAHKDLVSSQLRSNCHGLHGEAAVLSPTGLHLDERNRLLYFTEVTST